MKELPVSSKMELKRMLVDGAKILGSPGKDGECAYDRLKMTPINQLYKAGHEFNFDIDGAKFTGKIDRIDKLENGKYIIYDYKTGDRNDEKDICENGTYEDYYNQMAIYKHFLSKEFNCEYDDISAIFIFPRSFKQPFEVKLTDDDIKKLLINSRRRLSILKHINLPHPKNVIISARIKILIAV